MHKTISHFSTLLSIFLLSTNAAALSTLTERTVQKRLKADRVTQVDKWDYQGLMVQGSPCEEAFYSRSASAWIVEKAGHTALYVTSDDLDGLERCAAL